MWSNGGFYTRAPTLHSWRPTKTEPTIYAAAAADADLLDK